MALPARYQNFFEAIDVNDSSGILHKEEPYYCQDMYTILDGVIRNVLINGAGKDRAWCKSLLDAANETFQRDYMSRL